MNLFKSVETFFESFTENAAVTELRDACLHLEARIKELEAKLFGGQAEAPEAPVGNGVEVAPEAPTEQAIATPPVVEDVPVVDVTPVVAPVEQSTTADVQAAQGS